MEFELGGTVVHVEPHVDVLLLCAGLLVGYWALIRRFGVLVHPGPDERAVTRRQVGFFVGGVFFFWVADGLPLHDLAERYLYSAHMLQHLLQAFVVPPMILLGIPRWMGELLLRPTWLLAAAKRLTRPLVAGLAFNAVLLFVHWPAVVDLMLRSEAFHAFDHFLVLFTGFLMWTNICSPVPHLLPTLKPLGQMFYLFLMTLLPTIPTAFLTFGDTPLYPRYAEFDRVFGWSAVTDMQIAGLLMKVGGGFYLWTIIATMYFRWAAAHERDERAGGGPVPTPEAPTPA